MSPEDEGRDLLLLLGMDGDSSDAVEHVLDVLPNVGPLSGEQQARLLRWLFLVVDSSGDPMRLSRVANVATRLFVSAASSLVGTLYESGLQGQHDTQAREIDGKVPNEIISVPSLCEALLARASSTLGTPSHPNIKDYAQATKDTLLLANALVNHVDFISNTRACKSLINAVATFAIISIASLHDNDSSSTQSCIAFLNSILTTTINASPTRLVKLSTAVLDVSNVPLILSAVSAFVALSTDSADLAHAIVDTLVLDAPGTPQKISKQAVLCLVGFLARDSSRPVPGTPESMTSTSLALLTDLVQTGSLSLLSRLCFGTPESPKAIMESFTSSTYLRRLILGSFICSYINPESPAHLHPQLLQALLTWFANSPASITLADCEDVTRLLAHNPDTRLAEAVYVHTTTQLGVSVPQALHEVLLQLLCEGRSLPLDAHLGTLAYAFSAAAHAALDASEDSADFALARVQTLVGDAFHVGNGGSGNAARVQAALVEACVEAVEAEAAGEIPRGMFVGVLREVVGRVLVAPGVDVNVRAAGVRALIPLMRVQRGDAGRVKQVVSMCAGLCKGGELGAVEALVGMMRVALVERVSGGAGAVFDALVGVLGDQDADVETRAKVAGILGGIRVVHRGMVAETVQVSVPGSEDALTSLRLRASILEETNTVYGDIELLNMNSYFDIVLRVLKKEPSWQVYSSVLNSLEAQLINMVPIFQTASVLKSEYAEALRSHLCEIVESEIAAAGVTNLPLNVKKSDIYLTVFRCLGALVSWHAVFGKAQIEALLRCFQLGLHRWPSTARYCLQTLTIFLTELPGPMTRITPDNLMKVSRITSSSMAPHILEYLSTLARLPAIHVNLTEADYKRIFGIALGYIDADAAGEGPVGGFVLQMAYHVIGVWFVQMRVEDRRRYVSFIIGHVLAQRQPTTGGGEGFDESVELVMDMLVQNSYVDCLAKPDTFEDGAMTEGGESGDGMASGVAFGASVGASKDCIERSWIQGNSVLTIRNLKMSGWAEVTVRRSSGTVVFSVKLENRARFLNAEAASTANPVPAVAERQVSDLQIESGSVTLPDAVEPVSAGAEGGNITSFDHELSKEASSILSNQLQSTLSIRSLAQADPKVLPLDPSFLLLQMSPYPQSTPSQACLPLPSTEEAYIRALKVLDRTPVSELHKIGVLYVAPGQNDEVAILRNAHGSASYTRFVCALGQMVRLQGLRRAHTGGLDTSEAGVDGSTCVVWEDASSGSQIVFHITTLMPTVDTDPRCNLKKRHVGNDFVSVLYDESGGTDIGFDTIPGQFNYINIMVTPLGTSTYADYESQRFHVVSKVKPDLNLPSLGVFSDGFVVTGSVLAGVVRRAALHANMLAVVAAQTRAGGGSFTSNARERLRQIKKLAERARKATSGGASVLEGDRSSILDFTRYF